MLVFTISVLIFVLAALLWLRRTKDLRPASSTLFAFLATVASVFLLLFFLGRVASPGSAIFNFATLLLYALLLCMAPLMYYHVRSLARQEDLTSLVADAPYPLLPAATLFIINMFGFFIITFAPLESVFSSSAYEILFFLNFIAFTFLIVVQNLFYIFLGAKLYRTSVPMSGSSPQARQQHQWMGWFVLSYAALLLGLYIHQIGTKAQADWRLLCIEAGFVAWIVWKERHVSQGVRLAADEEVAVPDNKEVATMDEELQEAIYRRLEKVLADDRVYLQPDLSLTSLSKVVETNDKYLRLVIKKYYDQSFVSFINHFRVEAAKIMLIDTELDVYTIETIGQMAGFNSKSSFYAAFKELTGMTPYQYRQEQMKAGSEDKV